MIGTCFFVAGLVVAVIYLLLISFLFKKLRDEYPKIWFSLGEPSVLKASADSNIKVLKYLFNDDSKPPLAHVLKYLFVLFVIIFVCYVLLFFFE